jgi:hypothetical protein
MEIGLRKGLKFASRDSSRISRVDSGAFCRAIVRPMRRFAPWHALRAYFRLVKAC